MPYILCFMLFAVGLFAIATQRNLIKIIMGMVIIETSLNLFLVMLGWKTDGHAPILTREVAETTWRAQSVDPFPQAMVLTSIVIGLGVLSLLVALALRLYGRYGTFDITEIRKLRG